MDKKLTSLSPFFENPSKDFHIREVSRRIKLNHSSVRVYLNRFVRDGILALNKKDLYATYKLNLSKETHNLKLFYNLEKLRKSNLVEDLERTYDFPAIVLFGSYASANDDSTSDVDICLISNIKKEIDLEKYEKIINRKISIYIFTKKSWKNALLKNKGLVNNICNGITLSGKLEVV